ASSVLARPTASRTYRLRLLFRCPQDRSRFLHQPAANERHQAELVMLRNSQNRRYWTKGQCRAARSGLVAYPARCMNLDGHLWLCNQQRGHGLSTITPSQHSAMAAIITRVAQA